MNSIPAPTGEYSAAIAQGTVELHKRNRGRGPTRTRAHVGENFVLVISGEVQTTLETHLIADGRAESVMRQRAAYYAATRQGFIALVERHTGRAVVSFISGSDSDPSSLVELYLLTPASA